MKCIYCGGKLRTVNSRARSKTFSVWRRRACTACKAIFSSVEEPDLANSLRVRSPEGLEAFSRSKLIRSLETSLSHRTSPQNEAESLYYTLLASLLPCTGGVVEIKLIASSAFTILKRYDSPAATYYKAHYIK